MKTAFCFSEVVLFGNCLKTAPFAIVLCYKNVCGLSVSSALNFCGKQVKNDLKRH